MKKIFNEIEQKCNDYIDADVSGVAFKLNCQMENTADIKYDMMQYLPRNGKEKKSDAATGKIVEMFYVVDNEIFQKMKNYCCGKVSTKIYVFKSNEVSKKADLYEDGQYRIVYCDVEPYYLCTFENKVYTVLRTDSININRLYFRLMVEFVLCAKRMMGYHLIHAACVSIDEKAFIICGEKCAGKTTLMSHLLNSGKADFIANDKVFLAPDLAEVEYVPLVARIGGGTLNKFPKYDLKNDYHRINDADKEKGKSLLGNDKWSFTPIEMADIFSCEYKERGRLHTVLIPNIGEKNDDNIVGVNKDVLEYDLFSEENVKVQNWLLNDTWVEYYMNQDKRTVCDEKNNYKVYQVDYNYESKSSNIMNQICEKII